MARTSLCQDPGSYLGVGEGLSILHDTPGGHAHGHHLGAPSAGRLVVPHSYTNVSANACVQPPGDNPGPYTETESSGEVQKYAGMEREREIKD